MLNSGVNIETNYKAANDLAHRRAVDDFSSSKKTLKFLNILDESHCRGRR